MPDIHIHLHADTSIQLLEQIRTDIAALKGDVTTLTATTEEAMADLSALTTEVEQNSDVIDSAVVLLSSLSQQIRDLAADPAAIQALADELDANSARLADAVAANTPAAPTPPTP